MATARSSASQAADQSPSATWVMATNRCRRHSVRGESPVAAVTRSSTDGNGVPLSAPYVRITAAATAISRALAGSNGCTACAASTKMR